MNHHLTPLLAQHRAPRLVLALGLLTVLFACAPGRAATVVLNASGDTSIASTGQAYFDDSSYGGRADVGIRNYLERSALLRFDTTNLSSIGAGTINSVTLNLTLTADLLSGGSDLLLGQLTGANSGWVQGTGTGAGDYPAGGATNALANKTPGSAPDDSSPGTGLAWAGGGVLVNLYQGGGNYFVDNAATVYDLGPVPGAGYLAGSVLSITLDNSIISGWLADPNLALAGFVIGRTGDSGAGYGQNELLFSSLEAGSGAPTITVDFNAVPEPSTHALLGVALIVGVVSIARRRSIAN